jgi:LPS sulfotransferase NodH
MTGGLAPGRKLVDTSPADKGEVLPDMARVSVNDWYIEQFRDLDRRPDRRSGPVKKIVVLSTPRSGSTLFCDSLAATGLFGRPEEWLNPRRVEACGRLRGLETLNLGEYLGYVLNKTTSDNGVFSMKIQIDQYKAWKEGRNYDPLDLRFDTVFYVHRRDKVAQAHSYAKALRTDQWRSYFESKPGSADQPVARSATANALLQIVAWEEFYEANLSRRVNRTYCYEDIAGDDGFVRRALEDCGIAPAGALDGKPTTVVQRGKADLEEIEAFKRYISGSAG